jgi:Clp amino terminal domain, pathogenicity island component
MTERLSTAEAARILGVTRGRVVELATSDSGFPPSQPSPAGGRAWPRVAVEAWAATHPDRGPLHRGPTVPEVGGRAPQVWKVANLAGEDAQAQNHTWIGLDHLLSALVHPDCPGAARAVLASLGITAERLRQAHERSFIDPFEPGSGWKQVNPAFQLVLERANLEAVQLADAEVTSEHVLLALASHWAADARDMGLPPSGDLDPVGVRRRVLDVTEGMAVPPPPAPEPPLDPEEAMGRVAPGLELAPTPDGKDPRRRMPWGSRIFVDADGTPIKHTGDKRSSSTTSTVTATRSSPATGSRSTASSTSTAARSWPRTAGPWSSQSRSPRAHAWNHTPATLDST